MGVRTTPKFWTWMSDTPIFGSSISLYGAAKNWGVGHCHTRCLLEVQLNTVLLAANRPSRLLHNEASLVRCKKVDVGLNAFAVFI